YIVNRERIIKVFNYSLLKIRKHFSLEKKEFRIDNPFTKSNLKTRSQYILNKIFIINSWKKLGIVIFMILVFILNNFKLNDFIRFIILEFLIIFLAMIVLGILKKEKQVKKILFGQLYVPLIGIILAIEIFVIDLERSDISLNIFYITMTILVISLYVSISMYHSTDNKRFKLIHLVFSYMNIGLVCVIMFTYIGYGFMIFESKNLNLSTNEGTLNINGTKNSLNNIAIFISYGLDNLSQVSGIEIVKNKCNKCVNIEEVVFGLVSKVFISTYIALVLAFLGNTLFKKSSHH